MAGNRTSPQAYKPSKGTPSAAKRPTLAPPAVTGPNPTPAAAMTCTKGPSWADMMSNKTSWVPAASEPTAAPASTTTTTTTKTARTETFYLQTDSHSPAEGTPLWAVGEVQPAIPIPDDSVVRGREPPPGSKKGRIAFRRSAGWRTTSGSGRGDTPEPAPAPVTPTRSPRIQASKAERRNARQAICSAVRAAREAEEVGMVVDGRDEGLVRRVEAWMEGVTKAKREAGVYPEGQSP
ncbi:hypothetical protein B0H67DRAFT_550001 [Lasiosphaeris hirsuta]|uniref:Uncharacterized protein n=1 Tax=Lasiosphaeris hirsuta TaxID=260670 RepID=A0AA40AY59_9PEZI|nr:hypothetical protein B0H67DRAFT_550001 [Lasiosphaeris hirsuta]